MEISRVYLECADSTNLEVRRRAELGAEEGLCVIADRQTAGMGSKGRSFFSPSLTGLYMSILVKPAKTDPALLTCSAAASVCLALEERGKRPGIKWVNDVLLDAKKVCGILTQGFYTGSEGFAVVGIGVNLVPPPEGFPPELRDIAGAVWEESDDVRSLRNSLAESVSEGFFRMLGDPDGMKRIYLSRSVVPGRTVTVTDSEGSYRALALSINGDLSLKVKTDRGEIMNLYSQEVSLKLS